MENGLSHAGVPVISIGNLPTCYKDMNMAQIQRVVISMLSFYVVELAMKFNNLSFL